MFRHWAGDRYRLGHQPIESQKALRPYVASLLSAVPWPVRPRVASLEWSTWLLSPLVASLEVEYRAAVLRSMYSQATVS